MATDNKPAAAEPKTFVAIFTPKGAKGPAVELFKTMTDKARAPVFDGTIDGVRASAFLRKGPKKPFLSIVGDKKEGEANSPQIATANVVTSANGTPRLAITMTGQKEAVFASISKKVSDEVLVTLGLDIELQSKKRAEAATKAAAAPAAKKAPAPKPN